MKVCPHCGQETDLRPYDLGDFASFMRNGQLPDDLQLHDCGEYARVRTICGTCQKRVIPIQEQLGDRSDVGFEDSFTDRLKKLYDNQNNKDEALALLDHELIRFPFDWYLHRLKARTLLVFDEDDEAKRSFYEYFFYNIYDDLVSLEFDIKHMAKRLKTQKILKHDFTISQELNEGGEIMMYEFDELRCKIEWLSEKIHNELNIVDLYTKQGDYQNMTKKEFDGIKEGLK